jgi:hypothetical protein
MAAKAKLVRIQKGLYEYDFAAPVAKLRVKKRLSNWRNRQTLVMNSLCALQSGQA